MIFHQVQLLSRFKLLNNGQLDEFSDRLTYKFSCFIFFAIGCTILFKQYVIQPIVCYIPTEPGGSHLSDYVEDYCFIHGIVPISFNGTFPSNEDDWNKIDPQKIQYYQWVPFLLFTQGILCYLPHVIWRSINKSQQNSDFRHIISRASKATDMDDEKRQSEVIHLAKTLETLLFQQREEIQKTGLKSKFEKLKLYCVKWNKMGVPLVLFYMLIKVFYVLNSVGQIFLMQSFLNLDMEKYKFFGSKILYDIFNGRDWQVSLVFPRVGYCFAKIRQLGVVNYVTAQCALTINMLNEKIYIFLWFWMLFLSVASISSLLLWIMRTWFDQNKTDFLKLYLKLSGDYTNKELNTKKIKKFENYFLQHDGMFALRMMASTAGDLITAEVVSQLWKIYTPKYEEIKELDMEKLTNYIFQCKPSERTALTNVSSIRKESV